MNENGAETPEQVVKFAAKSGPRTYGFEVEEVGQAIVAKLQKAAELSNENCDRAMALAHKLAMELRGAEERINQLEAEVEVCRDRAARAEGWLRTIHKEIDEKLIAPRLASGAEQRSLP
jgi:hypothetical protein